MICFICNKITVRNAVSLFASDLSLKCDKSLITTVSEIIEKKINKDSVHSEILCKKCQKNVLEYDSLQYRLKVVKTEILDSFKSSLPAHNLNYETYNEDNSNSNVLPKNNVAKKLVLPASKLQPLPPGFVLTVGNSSMPKPVKILPKPATVMPNSATAMAKPVTIMPKIQNVMTLPSSSTLNLKVTVGTSVLTQSINTVTSKTKLTPLTMDPKLITTSKENSKNDHNSTKSVNSSKTSSILSFNVNSLPKDFLSSAILKVDADFDKTTTEKENDELENHEDSMEIDEDCSMTGLTKSSRHKLQFEGDNVITVDDEENKSETEYLDMKLLEGTDRQYVLGKIILEDDGDNDGDLEEHTILMDSESGSIIRVMSGQKILCSEDGQISFVDENDADASQDSNDESQIELQVSGDEETANAIIAAAQEQGGAFIKVESGEMYRVQSVESKTEEDDSLKLETQSAMISNEDGQFRCLMCERNNENTEEAIFVGDSEATMEHLKTFHSARLYICRICGHVERKKSDYAVHLESHNGKISKPVQTALKPRIHECNICDKKYHSRALLTAHMNMHSGSRPYTCNVCKKTFASKYTHQSHLKTHLDRPRPYKCRQCDKSFFTVQNLSQHEKTHSNVKDFVCNICGKAFGTQHNLEVHGVVHSGSKPFVCGICGKGFARRAEVRDHMRIHTGERPFVCDICGASFTQRSNLHSHKRATHLDDKRYHCTECPKKFKRRRLLDYHIKASHTGERPLSCEVCHATFVYPEHYKKHARIHSGEKPYKCEVCGKSFNSRDNRNTHRFVHSDRKPYECVVCGTGYMRKQLLYHHMNTSGHLAESIVVNHPRVTKQGENVVVVESKTNKLPIFAASEESEALGSDDKNGKTTISLVQASEDSTLLTLHNVEGEMDPLAENTLEDQQSSPQFRLVPINLPDGSSGWVAINT
ncbi:PR domain zinc finger protein 5-like isoform X1 [Maniola jurtina]|uniref:PR domain zinc finger protein 5-like isoform X1 n=2 Tax=Maniola jurtina TaxID=191418 RepID=UPI001E68E96D|nr:PR domain zinc finger protein 5-like isoform X1 [Maniola jurtina]XP_045781050.1 PR domain zinc finger protein 5-like isoform X1 [Maniola jurtina]XP_045781051.1 PR domain zinc finger protein 5-like isoform X1 [Maniola jurtina]